MWAYEKTAATLGGEEALLLLDELLTAAAGTETRATVVNMSTDAIRLASAGEEGRMANERGYCWAELALLFHGLLVNERKVRDSNVNARDRRLKCGQ